VGNVGAAIANAVLLGKSVNVVFDRNLSKAEGQAWDIRYHSIARGNGCDSINRYDDLADSDIGQCDWGTTYTWTDAARFIKGECRHSLSARAGIRPRGTGCQCDYRQQSVDVLTRIALETSTRSEHLIFGSGTVLDTARLSISLARALNVDKYDVHVQVIGEHGIVSSRLVKCCHWHDSVDGVSFAQGHITRTDSDRTHQVNA